MPPRRCIGQRTNAGWLRLGPGGSFAPIQNTPGTLLLAGLLAAQIAAGQTPEPSAPDLPQAAAVAEHPMFILRYANDYFTATDYYFTQGIYASFGTARLTVFAGQEGYTPTSISDPELRWGDRPYAGTLYGGARGRFAERRESESANSLRRQWTYEALIGIIGPQAKGEQQQRYIHRLIDDEAPMGWRYQIGNDLLLDVGVGFRQNLVRRRHFALDAAAEARVGTFRTRLAGGGEVRIGWPFLAAVIAPRVMVPLHDATLQGGFFGDSPYTLRYSEIDHVVGRVDIAIQGRIGHVVLNYTRTYETREILAGRRHAWGALGVSVMVKARGPKFSPLEESLWGREHAW